MPGRFILRSIQDRLLPPVPPVASEPDSGEHAVMMHRLAGDGYIRSVVGLDLAALGTRLVAFVTGADINTVLTSLMSVTVTVATAYVFGSKIIHEGRLKRRDEDYKQKRDQRLQDEADARESMTTQLENLKKQLAAADAARQEEARESEKNQLRMRDSLHMIRGDLNRAKLEAEALREDLHTTQDQLQEANSLIANLNAEIARLRRDAPPAVEHAAEKGAHEGARKAMSESQVDFPVVPPAAGGPDVEE